MIISLSFDPDVMAGDCLGGSALVAFKLGASVWNAIFLARPLKESSVMPTFAASHWSPTHHPTRTRSQLYVSVDGQLVTKERAIMAEGRDWLDALDRAVQEVEALQAIYFQDEDESTAIRFLVKSPSELLS